MSIIFTPILDVDMEIMNRLDDKSVYTMFHVNKFIHKMIKDDPSEYNSLYYKLITYKHQRRLIMEKLNSTAWICKYNNIKVNLQTYNDLNKLQLLVPTVNNLEIHPYQIRFKASNHDVINAIEKIVLYHGKNFKMQYIHFFDNDVFYDESILNCL
jgi:hypothetical protein